MPRWRIESRERRTTLRSPAVRGGTDREQGAWESALFVFCRLGHVHRGRAVAARQRDLWMSAETVCGPESVTARHRDQRDPYVHSRSPGRGEMADEVLRQAAAAEIRGDHEIMQ